MFLAMAFARPLSKSASFCRFNMLIGAKEVGDQ